tara:strand:+ start:3363 stop:6806 length:3444 start_codon:yes stop_codon:yes gene_type:complete
MTVYFAYINLEKDLERKEFMESQFKKLSITAHRIPARGPKGEKMDKVNGIDSRFNLKGDLTALDDGPPERKFELGLLCSHMEALRQFVKSGKQYGVILEDDAVLPEQQINCQKILENAPPGAETISLFSFPRNPQSIKDMKIANQNNRPFIKWTQYLFSSIAYIITRNGAIRCLKSCGASEPGRILCFNSYPVCDHLIYNNTTTYVLSCPIVFPNDNVDSTIHASHDDINREYTNLQKQKIPCQIIKSFTQKSNLLFSSVGDNTSAPEKWRSPSASYDIIQARYCGEITEYDLFFNKAGKFQNLLRWVRENNDIFKTYEYILVLDDDIALSPTEIELLFQNAKIHNAVVSSPSFDPVKGKISPTLDIMANVAGSKLRRTNYVEVTAPLFEARALEKFLNFYETHAKNLVGWGIDHLYRHVLWCPEKPFYIFDCVIAVNPRDQDKPMGEKGGREIDKLQSVSDRRAEWYSVADKLGIPRHVSPCVVSSPELHVINILEFLSVKKKVYDPRSLYLINSENEVVSQKHYNYMWINDGWSQVNMNRAVSMGTGWVAHSNKLTPIDNLDFPVMVLGGPIVFSGQVLKILIDRKFNFKKIEMLTKKYSVNLVICALFRICGIIMKCSQHGNKNHPRNSTVIYDIIKDINTNISTSIVTPTYKRVEFLGKLLECIKAQSINHNGIEWIIFDDSPEINKDAQNRTGIFSNLNFPYYYYWTSKWNRIGKKRNVMNRLAIGDIIICFDDDDLHHPDRIKHTISKLNSNPQIMLAGSTFSFLAMKNNGVVHSKNSEFTTVEYTDGSKEQIVSNLDIGDPIIAKTPTIYKIVGKKGLGFGPYHSTAGLMAYKREYAVAHEFREDVAYAEESYFTNKFNEPMVQLDPWKLILISCHDNNTYDKISYIKKGLVSKWCADVAISEKYKLNIIFYCDAELEKCISLFLSEDMGPTRKLETTIVSENLSDNTLFINCTTTTFKLNFLVGPINNHRRELLKCILQYKDFKMNISPYEFTAPQWKNKEKTVLCAKLSKWSGGDSLNLNYDVKNKLVQINDKYLDAQPRESWHNGSVKICWDSESDSGIGSLVKSFEIIMTNGQIDSAIVATRTGYKFDFIGDLLINSAGWVLEEPFYNGKTVHKLVNTKIKDFTKNKTLIKMFDYL